MAATDAINDGRDQSSSSVAVGSRKSELALVQTHFVIDQLSALNPNVKFTVVPMSTTGDDNLKQALYEIGSKALFTRELEVALLDGQVDFVVHSLKDMPTTLPKGLCIGAVLERQSPADCVVMAPGVEADSLASLPAGSRVGTSSVRRVAQLSRLYPHLTFHDVRGNLNTRLSKLDADGAQGDYQALVLAHAGMHRLNWTDRITATLPTQGDDACLYAVGQGALAVECRADDEKTLAMLRPLVHHATLMEATAERAVMRLLEGGCSVPIGVSCTWQSASTVLQLDAIVCAVDGSLLVSATASEPVHDEAAALALGAKVARQLIEAGAKEILAACRATK